MRRLALLKVNDPLLTKPCCHYFLLKCARSIFSVTGKWDRSLTRDVKKEIEEYWRPKLQESNLKRQDPFSQTGKDRYYVLSMFPYPSGKLHMGHVRVYTISDVMARFHRLRGKQVFHPIGWDAFGLPAENAALERGIEPGAWTKSNIASMRRQLEDLCCSFDWHAEVTTCEPSYYKWTQFIFLRMMEAGLAYQKEAEVNWDPVDKTVLANEQVDQQGRSWRSGAVVEKRYLKQWYIKTTAYSKALLEGLDEVDTSLWKDIVGIQKHWIGECTGCHLQFNSEILDVPLSVFTENPELVFGASHIAIATNHRLNDRSLYKNAGDEGKENIELSVQATHPFTGDLLPVIVSATTDFPVKCDTHLGIPDASEMDRKVAEELGFGVIPVLSEDNRLINSQQFTGMDKQQALEAITSVAREKQFGGHMTSAKLRDWLISRQRYWGTPIPVIHCPQCKAVPVPDKDLPVTLPSQSSGAGLMSLEHMTEWINTKCPKCGGPAKRETDTMDTFVDSSWYFLRYLDPQNDTQPFSKDRADAYMPVNLYIGGKEHALLHLYFARFFTHFLSHSGYISNREPFINLLTQGMVKGQSYRIKGSGKYISPEQVDFSGKKPVEKESGLPLVTEWEKMSKSKYNGVDPEDVIEEFGVDATRLCILSNVAPKTDRKWSNEVFQGVHNWQSRLWKIVGSYMENKRNVQDCNPELLNKHNELIYKARNHCVREVTKEMKTQFMLNAAISRFHTYTSMLKKVPVEVLACSELAESALADQVIMISPFAPSFASEMWSGMASVQPSSTKYNWNLSVLEQKWPEVDEDYKLNLKFQIDNSVVDGINLPRKQLDSLTAEDAVQILSTEKKFERTYSKIKNLEYSHFELDPGIEACLYFVSKNPKGESDEK